MNTSVELLLLTYTVQYVTGSDPTEWQGTCFGKDLPYAHWESDHQFINYGNELKCLQWAVDVVLICLAFHQIKNDMLYHLWAKQINSLV